MNPLALRGGRAVSIQRQQQLGYQPPKHDTHPARRPPPRRRTWPWPAAPRPAARSSPQTMGAGQGAWLAGRGRRGPSHAQCGPLCVSVVVVGRRADSGKSTGFCVCARDGARTFHCRESLTCTACIYSRALGRLHKVEGYEFIKGLEARLLPAQLLVARRPHGKLRGGGGPPCVRVLDGRCWRWGWFLRRGGVSGHCRARAQNGWMLCVFDVSSVDSIDRCPMHLVHVSAPLLLPPPCAAASARRLAKPPGGFPIHQQRQRLTPVVLVGPTCPAACCCGG